MYIAILPRFPPCCQFYLQKSSGYEQTAQKSQSKIVKKDEYCILSFFFMEFFDRFHPFLCL